MQIKMDDDIIFFLILRNMMLEMKIKYFLKIFFVMLRQINLRFSLNIQDILKIFSNMCEI